MKENGRSAKGGGRCDYKGLTIAGNGAVRVQGDAFCGSARRTGSASGVDCHGAAEVVDVFAVYRRVADEGRRVEVDDVGAAAAGSNVDGSPLEREEREERGGSRGGGVS